MLEPNALRVILEEQREKKEESGTYHESFSRLLPAVFYQLRLLQKLNGTVSYLHPA